jgi:hypothetical protein
LNTTIDHISLHYGTVRNRISRKHQIDQEIGLSHSNYHQNASLTLHWDVLLIPSFDRLYTNLSSFPSTPGASGIEGLLLDYFEKKVRSDREHIGRDDEKEEPLAYIELRASESRGFFLGMMMSSANFLKLSNSRFAVVAMGYRRMLLEFLRFLLRSSRNPTEIIMLACMLCSAEVSRTINYPSSNCH